MYLKLKEYLMCSILRGDSHPVLSRHCKYSQLSSLANSLPHNFGTERAS